MEVSDSYIFQIDDALVTNAYNNFDNYKIIYNEQEHVRKDLCVIYFSSNEIYYPNTATSFSRSILEKDKYEWKSNLLSYAYKHIFVRDIQKQWYIEGINNKVNSPEKLANLLKGLTLNYKVYTIGSSAGGFAAMLIGSLLGADKIYAFNAQLDLNIIIKGSTPKIDPILFKHLPDPERSFYYKIDNFVTSSIEYFYFQSCKSYMDIQQYNSFGKKELLNRIPFKTSNHGFPFLRHNLRYVMNLDSRGLKELTKKEVHPFLFSVKIDGFFKTALIVTSAIVNRAKKKLREKQESK